MTKMRILLIIIRYDVFRMKYKDTHSILFRIKVGGRNVILMQIWRNPEIDRKCQKYDNFFVKFETTPWMMPPC